MRKYSRLIQGGLFTLMLGVGLVVGAQEEKIWLQQLGSDKVETRTQASQQLTAKGPAVLGLLFNGMGGDNKTTEQWIRRTITDIVLLSTRPGTVEDWKSVESALLKILEGENPAPKRVFAIRLLAHAGREASVPVLAKGLDSEKERETARMTLEKIPGAKATEAVVQALASAKDAKWKAALIKTLGARRDLTGLPSLISAIKESEAAVRSTAVAALGNFSQPEAIAQLLPIWEKGADAEKRVAADSLLRIAERYIGEKQGAEAENIYRRFYQSTQSSLDRCAGLAGLAAVGGKEAAPLLVSALEDPDTQVRGLAQDRLMTLPGEAVTRKFIEALEKTQGESRVALINLIGKRQDAAVISAVPLLVQIVQKESGEIRKAAGAALSRMNSTEISREIVTILMQTTPDAQKELLRILGSQADASALPVIERFAQGSDVGLRAAALEALGHFNDLSVLSILKSALQENNAEIKNAAAGSAAAISVALQKASLKQAAIDLCVGAARAATNGEILRALIDRLQQLGAGQVLAEMVEKNGYIVHWWVIGPFPNRESLREKDAIATDQPIDLSASVQVGNRKRPWKYALVDNPLGFLDLEKAVARRDNVGAYLYAEVESPEEKEALFKLGSDDDVFCWLNGKLEHKFVGDRGWIADQDSVKVRLQKGVNRILLKVLNSGAQWAASLRITDVEGNGLPLKQKRP